MPSLLIRWRTGDHLLARLEKHVASWRGGRGVAYPSHVVWILDREVWTRAGCLHLIPIKNISTSHWLAAISRHNGDPTFDVLGLGAHADRSRFVTKARYLDCRDANESAVARGIRWSGVKWGAPKGPQRRTPPDPTVVDAHAREEGLGTRSRSEVPENIFRLLPLSDDGG